MQRTCFTLSGASQHTGLLCGLRCGARLISSTAARQTKAQHPLRVLFCGSDAFSIYSLRALHALREKHPGKVAAVDVLCRPDKRVGRNFKDIQSVPIKSVAKELGLPIHEVDSFKRWTTLSPFPNLIIAVSFGLLIPASVLALAEYGGLNVHPSLLPNLRGAAPLQHTLLRRLRTTGVSLQTMHPTKFDHGVVLAQRAVETFKSAEAEQLEPTTTQDLVHRLGPIGADMLVRGIEQELFIPPLKDVSSSHHAPSTLSLAPKITSQDRMINWEEWYAQDIVLRDHVLGRLWDTSTIERSIPKVGMAGKRITYSGPWVVKSTVGDGQSTRAGTPIVIHDQDVEGNATERLALTTKDNRLILPYAATIEGEGRDEGLPSLCRALKRL